MLLQSHNDAVPDAAVKRVRLIVTSADRNMSIDPTPASYTVTFDEPLVDVASMSLVNASVPLVAYQVSPQNSRLTFRIGGITRTISLPVGDYDPPSKLADQVAASIALSCDQPGIINVTYNETRDAFDFRAGEPFALLFDGGNSMAEASREGALDMGVLTPGGSLGDRAARYPANSSARILGFGPFTYASTELLQGVHQLTSPFRRDLSHMTTAILSISGADINVSIDGTLNRSFAVITSNGPYPSLSERISTKTFNPPVGKLPRLHVEFRDVYGNAYDFQNQDHILEFVVTCSPRYQSKPSWTVRA